MPDFAIVLLFLTFFVGGFGVGVLVSVPVEHSR